MKKVYLAISVLLMVAAGLAFFAASSAQYIYNGAAGSGGNNQAPRFICVQALIHTKIDKDSIAWYGQQSHSRNLKITWYVQPNILDVSTISVLKDYMARGDAVELSFGPVFFNVLELDQRIRLVDMQMDAFKDLFGYYPQMIESYYVDAYTLSYIHVNYPSVKGGVVYVNHESYADGFKSAGAYYMPYYPSKLNTLAPGVGEEKLDFVAFPFLQRDLGNCLLSGSNLFNLDPQDGAQKIQTWRPYFRNLLSAYLFGWNPYGLALYMVDLSYPVFQRPIIADDLTDLQTAITSGDATGLLDSLFVSLFKADFPESPEYNWIYQDPFTGLFINHWSFSPERRFGYVSGHLVEGKIFSHSYEVCYNRAVIPYDNSAV